MLFKKNYFIVANADFNFRNAKLRRQRYANYLLNKSDTESIIWIYPIKNKNSHLTSFKNFFSGNAKIKKLKQGKIIKIGIYDSIPSFILPKNFLTEKNLILRKSVADLLKVLDNTTGKLVLYFTHPSFPFLIKKRNWDAVIYDCSDLWSSSMQKSPGVFSILNRRIKTEDERKIIQSSNLVFATSDFLKKDIYNKTKQKATVIENGVDFKHFYRHDLINDSIFEEVPRPRFGFVGGMKPKIDFLRLEKLAISNPEWNFVLIGPTISRIKKLNNQILTLKNVYAYEAVKPEKIPLYLYNLDVGLLPYRDIKYNKAVFPLKLFEYLAAELPVVGWGVPSTKKYSKEGIYYYTNKLDTIDDISRLCKTALDDSKNKKFINNRNNIAKKENWDDKFDEILKHIDQIILNKI